jgi:hypothetical protein
MGHIVTIETENTQQPVAHQPKTKKKGDQE